MDARQFLAEFGHIVNAPDGVKRLREMVLDLAIQGDLLPQVQIENAKLLVNAIEAHKKDLIDNGRVKRQKPLPEIQENELDFHLPSNWVWVRFGNVCEIIRGVTFPASQKQGIKTEENVACLRTANVQVEIDWNNLIYIDPNHVKREDQWVINGDVIISMANSYELVGKVSLIREVKTKSTFGGFLASIRPHLLDSSYLYTLLRCPYMQNKMRGTASQTTNIANISLAGVRPIPIPLPPLEEQKRIVAKVDELMALCDKLEAQQQKRRKLQTLTRTTALDALANAQSPHELKDAWQRVHDNMLMLLNGGEDINTFKNTLVKLAVRGRLNQYSSDEVLLDDAISTTDAMRASYVEMKWLQKQKSVGHIDTEEGYYPSHWIITPFDAIAIVIGGVTKGRNLKDRETAFFPYLRVANVQRGYFNLSQMKEIEIPIEEFEKYQLMDGDLLITEGGDWDKVGRTAIWHKNIAKCLHQNHIFKARIPSNQILNEWVELVFNSEIGRAYFAGASKQTTNLASINMTQLRSFPFPVPPVSEQKEIIRKISGLLDICKLLDSYNKRKNNIAFLYSYSAIASMTGFQIKEDEQMKVPKTELISKLKLKVSPNNKDQAPLSAILAKHNGELSSKALWNYSGMKIDEFYQQLKTEMARDWIVEPEKARMIEKDADNQSGAEAG